MKENKKEIILNFDLPGFDKEDIDLKISKNSLLIHALKKQKKKIKKKGFFHYEKSLRKFSYATTLPEIVKNKPKVSFKRNLLTIKLLKK